MKCGNVIRDGYWDLVKGLCVMFVFSIHFIGDNSGDFFVYLIRQFSSMSVFVFIALAGYFTPTFDVLQSAPLKYVVKRVVRLTIPYLFWTIVFVVSLKNFDLSSWYAFFRGLLWRDLCLGYGVIVGYYAIVMLQLSILCPFLVKCSVFAPKRLLFISFVISVLTSFVATAASSKWVSVGIQAPVPFPGILFTMWIYPYSMGIIVKSYNLGLKLFYLRKQLFVSVVLLFVCVIIEDHLGKMLGIKSQAQFNLMGLLCATALISIIFAYHGRLPRIKMLETIGRGSYFIYLTHFRLMLYIFGFGAITSMDCKVQTLKYLSGVIIFMVFYYVIIIISECSLNKRVRSVIGM